MSIIPALGHAATLARLVADVIEGTLPTAADVARRLMGVGLDLVPVDELREYLDDEAKKRQEALYEAAGTAKFGPRG